MINYTCWIRLKQIGKNPNIDDLKKRIELYNQFIVADISSENDGYIAFSGCRNNLSSQLLKDSFDLLKDLSLLLSPDCIGMYRLLDLGDDFERIWWIHKNELMEYKEDFF